MTGEKTGLDEGGQAEETGEEEITFFLAGEGVCGLRGGHNEGEYLRRSDSVDTGEKLCGMTINMSQ